MTENLVYRLGQNCEIEDIEVGKTYEVKVQGFAKFGTFVYLNNRIKGLIHISNVKSDHKEGDTLYVYVKNIRDNGNIDLEEVRAPADFEIKTVSRKAAPLRLCDLKNRVGRNVMLDVEVAQIKQTSGPTIFTLVDETGSENAAAFTEAGKRSYPEVELGDMVSVSGEVMMRNGQLQIEVSHMEVLTEEEM